MITRNIIVVCLILAIVVVVAAWSKLRFVDDEDFKPQRMRIEEHPALNGGGR